MYVIVSPQVQPGKKVSTNIMGNQVKFEVAANNTTQSVSGKFNAKLNKYMNLTLHAK